MEQAAPGYMRGTIIVVSILLAGAVLLLADVGALVLLVLEDLPAVDLVMDFLDRTAMVFLLGRDLCCGTAVKLDP